MRIDCTSWDIHFDAAGVKPPAGLPAGASWHPIEVSSVWQEINPDYDGVAWYRTELVLSESDLSGHVRLCFGAVHYSCVVYCNEIEVGRHEGGYTPFSLGLECAAREGANTIHVRVLGPPRDREVEGMRVGSPMHQSNIPTWKAGWYYPFGGLWQAVYVETLPRVYAKDLVIKTSLDPKAIYASVEVRNLDALSESASILWRVYPWTKDASTPAAIASGTASIDLNGTNGQAQIETALEEALLWDLDTPNLYLLEVQLESSAGTHTLTQRFGLRTFTTDGAYFFLNGKRIMLRGTLHQGVFPKRIAAPHDEAMARRDLALLKEANCNFVRLHIKPAPVCTLDIADEIGLLCMEEPPVGWITYDEHVVNRAVHNVREMVRRDRNHPSLVLWCLFNELCDTIFTDTAEESTLIDPCYKAAREMDDSRLIIDKSGGRDGADNGKCKNGIHVPGRTDPLPIIDVHPYQRIPLKSQSHRQLGVLGEGRSGLLFTSEFGTSSFPDMDQLLDRYTDEEKSLNLREYRQMKNYRDHLAAGFETYDLAARFGTIAQFYQALQFDQCQATDGFQRSLRANERNVGYVITQHADAASEFGGVVDLWRHPKNVFSVFKRCNADRLLTVKPAEPSCYAGERLGVTVMVSDFTPAPVTVAGELSVNCDGKTLEILPFSGEGDLLATCLSQAVTLPGEGLYTLEARATANGEALTHSVTVWAVPRLHCLIQGPVYVYDLAGDRLPLEAHLQNCGYETRPFRNQHNDLSIPVVVRLQGRDAMQQRTEVQRVLRQFVEAGGKVLFVDCETASMPHFFGHGMREFYGVGAYAGNCGFALCDHIFSASGDHGHLGEPYAQGYPRIHVPMDDVLAHGYTPLTVHVVPYQFGNPDDIYWGCSCFTGSVGHGRFYCLQFHLDEFMQKSPVTASDCVRLIESMRAKPAPNPPEGKLARCSGAPIVEDNPDFLARPREKSRL